MTNTFQSIENEDKRGIYETREDVEGLQEKESIWAKIITAKTGGGSISEYLEHPLNFNRTEAVGRIIRGASGLFGSLDLAVVDILVGVVQMLTRKEQDNDLGRS